MSDMTREIELYFGDDVKRRGALGLHMLALFHWYVGRWKFWLLVIGAFIPAVMVADAISSRTADSAGLIKGVCFFAVLAIEVWAYGQSQKWRLFRNRADGKG